MPTVYIETTIVSYLTVCRAAGYRPPTICTPEELREATP